MIDAFAALLVFYSKLESSLKSPLRLFITLLLLSHANSVFSAKFVQLDEQQLSAVKTLINANAASPLTVSAYQALIEKADALLDVQDYTVIDKQILAPTNDPHDYLSISRYWWPDKSKADGLPWVRHDGDTNPDTQTDKVDRKRIGAMTTAVKNLSYAYYFSDNEAYAKKGVRLIKAWFLNPETRMNPHLEYAQSVPGVDKRRRSGILDGRLIPLWILDSIAIFSKSEHWSDADNKQMNKWLSSYLIWLTNSELGKSGAKQTNNHGSWYRFQTVALAWYLGETKLLAKQLKAAKVGLTKQLNKQGGQTHELERTKSYFYSCFNLNAVTRTAIIADKAGDSLWDYPSSESSDLLLAINYLIPAAQGEPWAHPTKGINTSCLIPVLERYTAYNDKSEHKKLLSKLLVDAKNEAKDGNYEARLIRNYALLNPSLID